MINYNQKKFRAVSNSENGEIEPGVLFNYTQTGDVVTCNYSSSKIHYGHLLAKVDTEGRLDMRYHQINSNGEIMTGICVSTPELMPNGKIRLHEKWQWTSGDLSQGESILEEV